MRTDPTDTGGLFTGRRPGTAPVRYRQAPERGGRRRRAFDTAFAALIAVVEGIVALLFWGPIPLAWLWVGSQVSYQLDDAVFVGILVAFFGTLATLMLGLMVMKRVDQVWIIVRRAAGHDQKQGIIGPVFAVTAILGVSIFSFWFIILQGPGSSFIPGQQ